MTFRTVLKELFRTPLKTLLFLLLLSLSAALLAVGVNLYASCETARREVASQYQTVGTIRQMPDSTKTTFFSLGSMGDGYFMDEPVYSTRLPEGIFDGLPAKFPVENRPLLFTTGKRDGGTDLNAYGGSRNYIFTFTTSEDVDTTDQAFLDAHASYQASFELDITLLSLNGKETKQPGLLLWSLDPAEFPTRLQAGTEYVAYGSLGYGSESIPFYLMQAPVTYHPSVFGNEPEYLEELVFENTPAFWNSAEGACFSAIQENTDALRTGVFPTVPTQSLLLLDPFYRGEVNIKYGRAITEEEFASGAKVCLIPENLATDPKGADEGGISPFSNYLQAGDTVSLTWRGAVYGMSPVYFSQDGGYMPTEMITADPLPVCEGGEYEIVGVYATNAVGGLNDMNLGYNEVIVPAASFDFSSVPVLCGGPVQPASCSFQLENGTADRFMEAVSALGYENLQVGINDQGYTSIAKGLDAVGLIAFILLLAGGISALCLLLFFVYLQIARKQREAAVQISLGAGKRRCAAFLMLSVMLVILLGAAAGSLIGHQVTGSVSAQVFSQAKTSGYSRDYSDQFESGMDVDYAYEGGASPLWSLVSGLSIAGAGLLLAAGFTARSLRKEPLEQLTRKE